MLSFRSHTSAAAGETPLVGHVLRERAQYPTKVLFKFVVRIDHAAERMCVPLKGCAGHYVNESHRRTVSVKKS